MNTIIVLVGVAGAGKSTLLENVKNINGLKILQPSTSRDKRAGESDEYHYIKKAEWKDADFAWTINARANFYGLRLTELDSLQPGAVGLTVFHPGNLHVLEEYRKASIREFITIGVDTIGSYEELKKRIKNDPNRDEGEKAFESQIEIVRKCDCVIHGNNSIITDALKSIIVSLKFRGVLDQRTITNLINAGTLLGNAHSDNAQSASYDLRVGNIVLCRGEKTTLKQNDIVKIPPYSYVIIEAHESAMLPKFIIAHYDLKVSLFTQGIILSNGPQVDPGYHGVLLCLLFNGSDVEVGIKCGGHFATIEFLTTSNVTSGYKDHHQHQNTLDAFVDQSAHVSPGGTIVKQFDTLKSSWDGYKMAFILTGLGIGLATVVGLVALGIWAFETMEKVSTATMQAHTATDKLPGMIEAYSNSMSQVNMALQNMQKLQFSVSNRYLVPTVSATNTTKTLTQ